MEKKLTEGFHWSIISPLTLLNGRDSVDRKAHKGFLVCPYLH